MKLDYGISALVWHTPESDFSNTCMKIREEIGYLPFHIVKNEI